MHLITILSVTSIMGLVNANPVTAPAESTDLPVIFTEVPLSEIRIAELEGTAASNDSIITRQNSCTWTAFNGNFCDSGPGDAVLIGSNGACIRTQDRHSFYISSGCPDLLNLAREQLGCSGRSTSSRNRPGACYNVNTGYNWASSFVYKYNS